MGVSEAQARSVLRVASTRGFPTMSISNQTLASTQAPRT